MAIFRDNTTSPVLQFQQQALLPGARKGRNFQVTYTATAGQLGWSPVLGAASTTQETPRAALYPPGTQLQTCFLFSQLHLTWSRLVSTDTILMVAVLLAASETGRTVTL